MARWDRILSRGNVEDRRSMAPAAAGTIGTAGVIFLIAINLLSGGSIDQVLTQLQDLEIQQNQTLSSIEFQGEDTYETFASTVLGSANQMWTQIFAEKGLAYNLPKLILFRQATESSCGIATSSVGPHYCPIDNQIYLDETFFEELETYLGAKGGDVAEAYVIAHEIGHHVQNQLGILKSSARSQQASINTELQADCFAGLWLNSIKNQNILQPGEIEEALDAAATVGDNRIQEKTTGQINPETWTHGSSEQRVQWFNVGYKTGSFEECNTFN